MEPSTNEIVKAVIAASWQGGLVIALRNNAGETALDLAQENGNEEILALIEAAKH